MKNSKLKKKIISGWFFLYNLWSPIHKWFSLRIIRAKYSVAIMTSEETIAYIKDNGCSIARYGDGDFGLMLKTSAEGYQEISDGLSDALKEVFRNASPELLICIPYPLKSTKEFHKRGKRFWRNWALQNQKTVVTEIRKIMGRKYLFGDSFVSRPFTGYKSKEKANALFPQLKKLWEDRDILFVEGEGTRLGIGNDLFSNARSIKRILAPAENAFRVHQELLETVSTVWKGELVIMALGPTATVLASELSKRGIQALDIGHIDIQYEWYLTGKPYKPVKNKYVNEAKGAAWFEACEDPRYLSQIIARVPQQ